MEHKQREKLHTCEDCKTKPVKEHGGVVQDSPCETISEAGAGLRTKRTGLFLSGPKSSSAKSNFCISFRNQGPRYTEFKLHCEVSTAADGLGKHIIYWCWYTMFYQAQGQRSCLPGDFWAHHASFCWPVLWRCGFSFLAPAHTAKRSNSCFKDQGIPELEVFLYGAHSTPQDLDQEVYLKRGKALCTNTPVKYSGDFFLQNL